MLGDTDRRSWNVSDNVLIISCEFRNRKLPWRVYRVRQCARRVFPVICYSAFHLTDDITPYVLIHASWGCFFDHSPKLINLTLSFPTMSSKSRKIWYERCWPPLPTSEGTNFVMNIAVVTGRIYLLSIRPILQVHSPPRKVQSFL